MPIAKAKGKSDFKPVPEGLHIAVCYAVIGLGTQIVTYQDKKKEMEKVCLIWELPNVDPIEIDGEMKPKVISNMYTNSLDKKANLRKHLESWRGKSFTPEQLKGFDLDLLIGANCQIQVIHNHVDENVYANISTIVNVPSGHKKIKPQNPTVTYNIGDTIPDDKIPEWICKIIREAKEWGEMGEDKGSPKDEDVPGEEIPEEVTDVEPF